MSVIKGTSESDTATLFSATPYTSSSAYKCAIIAQGLSNYSKSKLHFCFNSVDDNTYPTQNASLSNSRMVIDYNGRVGISNSDPQSTLHLGNCTVANSAPVIIFGKNINGGFRNAFMGYTDSFFFVIGDYGNTNGANTLTQQLASVYSAPALSLLIASSGYVTMQYGYGGASDERIKTNIKTIENAFDKTLLLRGVEYNDIRIEPEKTKIGLIAQEVELIIPEVVTTGDDGMKSIAYQNLVGLLVEAIKEQQKQINDLKNILKNNNLS